MIKESSEKEKVTVPARMFVCLDDKAENYLVEIELPGADKSSIELNMYEDLVSVRATRSDAMYVGHRHFPLRVQPKKADATFKQGLVKVKVPVKEKPSPAVRVEIK